MATLILPQRSSLIATISVLIFLMLLYPAWKRGQQGALHRVSLEFWQKESWHELRSLGENLYRTGQADAESMYLAMLASQQLSNPEGVHSFAVRFLEQKALNWKMESRVSALYRPNSLREWLPLYRTRAVILLCGGLTVLLIFSILKRRPLTVPIVSLSLASCILLIL